MQPTSLQNLACVYLSTHQGPLGTICSTKTTRFQKSARGSKNSSFSTDGWFLLQISQVHKFMLRLKVQEVFGFIARSSHARESNTFRLPAHLLLGDTSAWTCKLNKILGYICFFLIRPSLKVFSFPMRSMSKLAWNRKLLIVRCSQIDMANSSKFDNRVSWKRPDEYSDVSCSEEQLLETEAAFRGFQASRLATFRHTQFLDKSRCHLCNVGAVSLMTAFIQPYQESWFLVTEFFDAAAWSEKQVVSSC